MNKIKFEKQLNACFARQLDKTILNQDLVVFIDSLSNSKCLPISAVFADILTATSSICYAAPRPKEQNKIICIRDLMFLSVGCLAQKSE